jgi:hypothetical protein
VILERGRALKSAAAAIGAAVVLAAPSAVVSAGASTGHDSIRFTPAGQAMARGVALRETDLESTVPWRPAKAQADPSATDHCGGWNPPASHAVVIGAAARRFVAPGLDVSSEVDILKSSSSVDLEPLNLPWIPYARHTMGYRMIVGVKRANLTVLVTVDLAGFTVGRCLIDLVTVGVLGEPGTDLASEGQVARTLAYRAFSLNGPSAQ